MSTGNNSEREISSAVRNAFERLLRRSGADAEDIVSRWNTKLDAPKTNGRKIRHLISNRSEGGVRVDDLLRVSYCLNVSPGVVLDLAWRDDPWDFLNLTVSGASVPRSRMSRWLAGREPLPGQDEKYFSQHQMPEAIIQEGGPGWVGSLHLAFLDAIEAALSAARVGDTQALRDAEQRLRAICLSAARAISKHGALEGLDDQDNDPFARRTRL